MISFIVGFFVGAFVTGFICGLLSMAADDHEQRRREK